MRSRLPDACCRRARRSNRNALLVDHGGIGSRFVFCRHRHDNRLIAPIAKPLFRTVWQYNRAAISVSCGPGVSAEKTLTFWFAGSGVSVTATDSRAIRTDLPVAQRFDSPGPRTQDDDAEQRRHADEVAGLTGTPDVLGAGEGQAQQMQVSTDSIRSVRSRAGPRAGLVCPARNGCTPE